MAASAIGFGPFGFSVLSFFNLCDTSNWIDEMSIWKKIFYSLNVHGNDAP